MLILQSFYITFITLVVYVTLIFGQELQIPVPQFEVLWPYKGLRVSITDTGNIKNFVFHGKLNEEMGPDDLGKQWSHNTIVKINGLFRIDDYKTKLKIGDIIYYRILVGFKNLTRPNDYKTLSGFWTVKNYVFNNGTIVPNSLIPDADFCYQSETIVNGKYSCVGQQIFNEDFNDTEILSEKWFKEHRNAGAPNYEFVIYNKNSTNSYIKNGLFIIKPTLLKDTFGENAIEECLDLGDQCTGIKNTNDCKVTPKFGRIQNPVLSAKIISRVSFRFGRISIRAKLPCGKWLYPELYLVPKNVQYGDTTNCISFPGQMRIAFKKSLESLLSAGLLRCSNHNQSWRSEDAKNTILKNVEDFHEFTFYWGPDKITTSVDGMQFGEIIPSRINHQSEQLAFGTNSMEVNLIIGLGAGGINEFSDEEPGKPWKNLHPKNILHFWQNYEEWWPTWQNESGQLQIDYIKIYAL